MVKKEQLYDVRVEANASWLDNHVTISAQNVTRKQGEAIQKLIFSFDGGYTSLWDEKDE